jgi:hypothetical protein
MAPVAAKPPNSGAAMLARPCAMSSWLGSWRSSIWLSATRAESSDSMAPSSAMVIAGEISLPSVDQTASGRPKGGQLLRDAAKAAADGVDRQREQGVDRGADDQHGQRAGQRGAARRSSAASRFHDSRKTSRPPTGPPWAGRRYGQVGGQGLDLGEELAGQVVDLQAEEILDLGEEDHHRDAVGEADHHRQRDEADQLPMRSAPMASSMHAGQHGGDEQVLHAVVGDDGVDDGDEGAGGAADLHPRAAEAEIRKPATMAVQMPAVGDMPEAIAKAIASGRASTPTVMPAERSLPSCARL